MGNFSLSKNIVEIDRSKVFNPVEFIAIGWSVVKEDSRSLVLTELDPKEYILANMLPEGNAGVKCSERLDALTTAGHVRLDARIGQTFFEKPDCVPDKWKSGICLFFDGTILRSPRGNLAILYLCWRDSQYYRRCHHLNDECGVNDMSLINLGANALDVVF